MVAVEHSGLGSDGDDESDLGLDEETGTLVEEPDLTMNDLQILVGKRDAKELKDALAAEHVGGGDTSAAVYDILQTLTDSVLCASAWTGPAPSAADMDRAFAR